MLRFISRWMGFHYEPCRCCEVYRYQIEIVNNEKRELLNVILSLVKPQIHIEYPKESKPLNPIPPVGSWLRRRHLMEDADRVRAQALANSPFAEANMKEREATISNVEDEIRKVEAILGGGEEDASQKRKTV